MRKRHHVKMIVRLFNRQGGRCAYCGEKMHAHPDDQHDPLMPTKDHIVPRSKGGVSAEWNYVAACARCNNHKGDMPAFDFIYQITRGKPEQHWMFDHPACRPQ